MSVCRPPGSKDGYARPHVLRGLLAFRVFGAERHPADADRCGPGEGFVTPDAFDGAFHFRWQFDRVVRRREQSRHNHVRRDLEWFDGRAKVDRLRVQ